MKRLFKGRVLRRTNWFDYTRDHDKVAFQFLWRWEPRDIWWGVYWTTKPVEDGNSTEFDIYVCLVPMLPLHITGYVLPR